MAINYLNNVNFNRNELQDAQLIRSQVENQPNDAAVGGTPVEGQLYFNTTSDVLKVYGNGSWSEVGGGVETLTTTDGTYIDLTPNSATAGAVTVTADLSAVDGTSVAATRFLSKDNTWDVPTYPSDNDTTYDISGVGSTNGTAGVRLAGSDSTTSDVLIVGGGTTTVTRSANTLTVTSNDEFDGTVTSVAATHAGNAFTASIGNTSTINPSVDITMAGASTDYINGLGNLTAFPAIPQGDVTGIDAGTYISIADGGTATPTVNALGTTAATASRLVARDASGYGYVVTPASGDSSTKIPTTEWVNQKLTGLLEFKGGFNASTGAIVGGGNLTSGATRVAVAVGDYYVVTVAGDFFGSALTPLTVGDSVIVQTAAVAGASVEGDFVIVQSDTDLATASTVGLGNVAPGGAIDVSYSSGTATVSVEDSTASNKGAVIVAASTSDDLLGINVAYSGGTATVGLDITGLNAITTTDDASELAIYDEDNTTNKKISVGNLALAGNSGTSKTGTIAAGSLSGTVTHAFGINTLVQTIDASGNTVFCDITRTATTSVATISVVEATAITILVQKIG